MAQSLCVCKYPVVIGPCLGDLILYGTYSKQNYIYKTKNFTTKFFFLVKSVCKVST